MVCIARSLCKVKLFSTLLAVYCVSILDYKLFMKYLFFSVLIFILLCSCSADKDDITESKNANKSPKGCLGCHAMVLDTSHDIDCSVCHGGNQESNNKENGHKNLIKQPSHPNHMLTTCGKCHEEYVKESRHSLHFTLKNEVNRVRESFGAKTPIQSLTEIPIVQTPQTPLELADDLLRRRCLRCHPYYSGDNYPEVSRGTGCASCHLEFYEGKLVSHSFLRKPGDKQCLQCHYGNWVGADYYGRYEHDMNDEYRTPYTTRNDYFRPFGIEFHQLVPDIHQQKGLICIDCHGGNQLMSAKAAKIRCVDCHKEDLISQNIPTGNIDYSDNNNTYNLLSYGDGKLHQIPMMQHIAHVQYNDFTGCQVCHAQWSYNDSGIHLLRRDQEEFDDFSKLTIQGSFEVETILSNNLNFDADELDYVMSDKITGTQGIGLWMKGYEIRRWEEIVIGRDANGFLQVMRPLLDFQLSWVDENEEVIFDSIQGKAPANGMLPYVPHTTGKAGLFYQQRIDSYLSSEKL